MNTVKVILATLVIFGAGVITGAFAVRIAQGHNTPSLPSQRQAQFGSNTPALMAPNTPFNRPDFLARLSREVALRPDQHARVEEILRESRKRTEPMISEFGPKIRAETRQVREQILEVLNPEQRLHFDEVWRPNANRNPDQMNRPNRDPQRRLPSESRQPGQFESLPGRVPAAGGNLPPAPRSMASSNSPALPRSQ